MLPTLSDDLVALRPWRATDAATLHRAMQDPEIVRWMAIDQPYALEHAEGFIAGVGRAREERTAAHFVIELENRLVGYLGVLSVEHGMQVVELGYRVVAETRGEVWPGLPWRWRWGGFGTSWRPRGSSSECSPGTTRHAGPPRRTGSCSSGPSQAGSFLTASQPTSGCSRWADSSSCERRLPTPETRFGIRATLTTQA